MQIHKNIGGYEFSLVDEKSGEEYIIGEVKEIKCEIGDIDRKCVNDKNKLTVSVKIPSREMFKIKREIFKAKRKGKKVCRLLAARDKIEERLNKLKQKDGE